MKGYEEDKNIPGLYVPSETLKEEDLDWKEKEIELYSKISNSPTFAENLRKFNGLNHVKKKTKKTNE